MIRGGTVALSFFQNWIAMKATRRTPKTTKRAMMRPLLHLWRGVGLATTEYLDSIRLLHLRVLAPSPLQRQQEADDHWQEDDGTKHIELLQLFPPGGSEALSAGFGVVEDDDEEHRHGADRQVDVEAPSP